MREYINNYISLFPMLESRLTGVYCSYAKKGAS